LTVCSFMMTGQHLNIFEPLNPSFRYKSADRITRVGFGAHKLYRSCTHCGLFVCRKRLASYPWRAWWWLVIVVNCFKSPSAVNIQKYQQLFTALRTLTTLNILYGLVHLSIWAKPFIIVREIFKIRTDWVANSAWSVCKDVPADLGPHLLYWQNILPHAR
jgi:hypothetical protein